MSSSQVHSVLPQVTYSLPPPPSTLPHCCGRRLYHMWVCYIYRTGQGRRIRFIFRGRIREWNGILEINCIINDSENIRHKSQTRLSNDLWYFFFPQNLGYQCHLKKNDIMASLGAAKQSGNRALTQCLWHSKLALNGLRVDQILCWV